MSAETVTSARRYRGYIIETVTQDSGRKTYDIRTADGEIVEWAAERLVIAKAFIDATIDQEN